VSPVVLVGDSFAALPHVLSEGRRVIANVERVANLFVSKTVYAFLLAVAVGVARLPFPFLPRHLTIVSSLTIGVPAFFLALSPNAARHRPGFVRRVFHFAIPGGAVAAAATFLAYALVRAEPDASLAQSRTAATMTLFGVGIWILSILARPWTYGRRVLVASLVVAFAVLLAVRPAREFFAIDLPRPMTTFAVIGIVAIASFTLELGWQLAHEVEAALRRRQGSKDPGGDGR
jgi:cation-transporting ATPase E